MLFWLCLATALLSPPPVSAVVLWSDLGQTLVHENGTGTDILGGAVKRDTNSTGTLYFKFHVDPLSDVGTEEYFAGFQLFENDAEKLAIGNSLKAWAYSAFNTAETGPSNKVSGDFDLSTARPESSAPGVFFPYELPRRGIERTIVFRVKYQPGAEDEVTVWLNPDLAPGATEEGQAENLTTRFKADAAFNEIRLRHGGGGGGWTFSDMEIATAFSDFVSAGTPDSTVEASGGPVGVQALTFRAWHREEGLPQNSVQALAQTHDGYLWIGNDDGICRFDGVRFVSFGLREGLRSGSVRTLFEDDKYALWIGTAGGGLTRMQEGRFTTFTTQDHLPSDSITALAQDSQGRLWVGTEAGLSIFENGRFAPLPALKGFPGKAISALARDRKGQMWVGIAGVGVFRYENDRLVQLADPSAESLLQDTHCLLVDGSGRIWIGAGDDFLLCRDGEQWRRYRMPRHLARPYVNTLAEEPDGTVWAGSVSEGLFQFKGGRLVTIDARSGLSDNAVQALLVDRESNLWVGTAGGLNRLRRSNLTVFGQNEGLGYGPVQGLAEVGPGTIWAGKPLEGIYRWQGRSFALLSGTDVSQRAPDVITLLEASDKSCWVGGGKGLWQFKSPETAKGEIEVAALAGLNVLSIAEGAGGEIWVGTREGQLWRRADGNWSMQTNYSLSRPITAIARDKDGAIWIGTDGAGLYRVKGEGRTHFGKGGRLLSDTVLCLYADAKGVVWIGTAGGGLTLWRDGDLATVTTKEGLPDNTISQVLEDSSERLWLGSNRGIACVSKHELEEFAAGKVRSVYPGLYGRAEGMASEECTGGFSPAGLKTKEGILWFPTMKGIVVIDPRPQRSDAPPPAVVLEETLVDGVVAAAGANTAPPALPPLSLDGGIHPSATDSNRTAELVPASARGKSDAVLRIPPGQHRLEFHYTGMNFSAPERVYFRYRLVGLDSDWVEAEGQRSAVYNYVPPGQYQFQVMARSSGGKWNEAGATLLLVVLPHYWQDWRFIVVASILLLALVGGVARLVEKRKHQRRLKELEQERAIEKERARIAQDLHDDLGSSLTRISLLSDLARADKDHPHQVEVHAQKISQSAGQTVRALEEIVWALRPGSDSLQSLVDYIAHFANELFEGDKARCRLDLPHDLPAHSLPPEMRHNIFLIVKEALTNALKHAAATEVRVQAKIAGERLEILVQDNGRGFNPPSKSNPTQRHGVGNMRRRAESIGGDLSLESSPGAGSSMRLSVKLPPPHAIYSTPDPEEIRDGA
jgi:ligand-binding sensor domain-containing protein/signal transduction histidine kinase